MRQIYVFLMLLLLSSYRCLAAGEAQQYEGKYPFYNEPLIALDRGIVYDANTKLFWASQPDSGNMSLGEAVNIISSLNQAAFLGFCDWRMPTEDELTSLIANGIRVGYGLSSSTIADYLVSQGLNGAASHYYWTSTKFDNGNSRIIDFEYGSYKASDGTRSFLWDGSRARESKIGFLLPVRGKAVIKD